jgi:hypothetical protein
MSSKAISGESSNEANRGINAAETEYDLVGTAFAFTPNLISANFQAVAGNLYFPRQFGPTDAQGQDVFEAYVSAEFSNSYFVDDFYLYHRLFGEVHCGSLVKRQVLQFGWWDEID